MRCTSGSNSPPAAPIRQSRIIACCGSLERSICRSAVGRRRGTATQASAHQENVVAIDTPRGDRHGLLRRSRRVAGRRVREHGRAVRRTWASSGCGTARPSGIGRTSRTRSWSSRPRANPFFVGRADELLQVAKALCGGDTTVALGQVVASTGLGGLRKTQLAVELVHRYGRYFVGGVFWVSFARPDEIPLQVAGCAGPGVEARPLEERVRGAKEAWQTAAPRLLVFDNCEEEALLAAWRPPSCGCRVLVTSRRSVWSPTPGVTALRLDLLSRCGQHRVAAARPAGPCGRRTGPRCAHRGVGRSAAGAAPGRHLAKSAGRSLVVRLAGVEPAASCSAGMRSIR